MKKCNEKGFTLIEVMVVLVIGIIVIAVAAGGIGRAFASNEATTETRNINDLMANIQTLKGFDGYDSVNMALLAKVDGIPASLTNSDTGTGVLNSWSGAVTVTGNENAFTISYAAVPQAACIQLATKTAEAGALNVHVGSTAVKTAGDASTTCGTTPNTMTFTYNATAPVS